jgi:hypothetical protein
MPKHRSPGHHPLYAKRLVHPDDHPAMIEAIGLLTRARISFIRVSPVQLKIGPLNFYPASGTLYLDGASLRMEQRGLPGLRQIIERQLQRRAAARSPHGSSPPHRPRPSLEPSRPLSSTPDRSANSRAAARARDDVPF